MQHMKVKIVFLGEKQYIFLKKVFSFIASFVGGHGIIFFQKKKIYTSMIIKIYHTSAHNNYERKWT